MIFSKTLKKVLNFLNLFCRRKSVSYKTSSKFNVQSYCNKKSIFYVIMLRLLRLLQQWPKLQIRRQKCSVCSVYHIKNCQCFRFLIFGMLIFKRNKCVNKKKIFSDRKPFKFCLIVFEKMKNRLVKIFYLSDSESFAATRTTDMFVFKSTQFVGMFCVS